MTLPHLRPGVLHVESAGFAVEVTPRPRVEQAVNSTLGRGFSP